MPVKFKMVSNSKCLEKVHIIYMCLRSFPNAGFKTVPVTMFVWLIMALSHHFKEDHCALFLFMPLSSRWLMGWCPWLFLPAGNVSSSSTVQIFQDATHLLGVLCPSVCLLGHFLHSGVSRAVHPQEFQKVDIDHWDMHLSGLPFPLLLLSVL